MSEIEKEAAAPKAPKAPKMFKVTIHSGEDDADKGDVMLAHNYKNLLIQRDQEVTIPETYVEVLKHSVTETTVKTDGVERIVRVPRFAFNIAPV